jgi:glutathione reductase (NADPH)
VQVIEGTAVFAAPNEIDVASIRYTADNFAIAAGAVPAPLNFPGHEAVLTSDNFLELDDILGHVVFLGGGYISLEFATVVAACGRSVTIIDRHDHVLKGFDPDLVGLLTEHLKERGIDFRMNDEIAAVTTRDNAGLRVETTSGASIDCDMVVHGAGRVPNVAPMNLSAAKIDADDTGIFVDAYLRSRSNPNVYVAGDCVAGETAKLTPTAEYHAEIVAKNLQRDAPTHRRGEIVIPAVAFTVPALASVGISEQKAREDGKQVAVRFENDSTKGNVRKALHAVAAHKIIVDTTTDRILGAHLIGPAAEETINLFALAIQHDLTATQLKSMHYGYPTFAADIRGML